MKLPTNCKMLVNANLMALEWDINPQGPLLNSSY